MQKYNPKNVQKGDNKYKPFADKSVKRFQQNAARLERSNVRNKNKGKKN